MASIARKIKRGQFEKVENKLTGNVELFRKGRHSLVFTGYSYKKPKAEIEL